MADRWHVIAGAMFESQNQLESIHRATAGRNIDFPVLDRFTEGFATADFLAASALRAELQS